MGCAMEIDLGEDETLFAVDFHPSDSLFATGFISGELRLYRYREDSQPEMLLDTIAHEKGSCRAVRFVNSGQVLLTASNDRSILATDMETGKTIARLHDAHGDAVNRLINLTESTIASADDSGCIKVWDTRNRTCRNTFNLHNEYEYISDMTYVSSSLHLLATSRNGISICDLRRNEVPCTEFANDELLSVVTMKNGQKVVCGTQTGTLLVYSWGHMRDGSDHFVNSPQRKPVDALLELDEDTLISGSEDGVIRLVGISPNRIIRPIAHSKYSIEGLAFSHDRRYLCSMSHDPILKMWDLQELLDNQKGAPSNHVMANDSVEMDVDVSYSRSTPGSKRKRLSNTQSSNDTYSNFFSDL